MIFPSGYEGDMISLSSQTDLYRIPVTERSLNDPDRDAIFPGYSVGEDLQSPVQRQRYGESSGMHGYRTRRRWHRCQ